MSQYHYAGRKKYFEQSKSVLQQAFEFCEDEENGFYESVGDVEDDEEEQGQQSASV